GIDRDRGRGLEQGVAHRPRGVGCAAERNRVGGLAAGGSPRGRGRALRGTVRLAECGTMRIFATREYVLSRLPFGARLFYSLFLVMVFLGLLTCLGFAFAKSGFASSALADYYRGDDSGSGAKPFVELLETAHFHLFSMPIFFLVLGHIFFL